MDHYINTNATDLSRAKTVGLLNLLPQPFPVMMVGTRSTNRFFFANDGVLESWSGDSTYSLRVTVGDAVAGPIASTFQLLVGPDPITINFDVNQAGLQNILNAATSISEDGGVDVVGQGPGRFLIAYREAGVPTDELTTNGALLLPDCNAVLDVLTPGDSETRQLVMLTLTRVTPAQVTSWTPITSPYAGWEGVIPLTSSACYQLIRLNGQKVGAYYECTTLLTVEVIDSSGNNFAYYQTQILLRAQNYMITSLLPIGPSQHTQSSSAAGTITVTPESQFHTETINFTGSNASPRDVVISSIPGLGAGAHIDIVALFPLGAQNGTEVRVYRINTNSSNLLFDFYRNNDEASALLETYYADSGTIQPKVATIPAFAV